jgi:hypothetical protein
MWNSLKTVSQVVVMSDVFISYSREDREVAKTLSAKLRERGCNVFLDESVLVSGVDFSRLIISNMLEAKVIIALLSSNTRRSKWVQEELAVALEQGGSGHVIPVLLDAGGKQNWVWPLVADRKAINLKDELRGVDAVVDSVCAMLSESVSAPLDRKMKEGLSITPPPHPASFAYPRRHLAMLVFALVSVLALLADKFFIVDTKPFAISALGQVLASLASGMVVGFAVGYWVHWRR